ncbi:Predicted arabinose efflux permease, MFS family [Methanococcoides vulcani]|uniref:Predicted arabinose efflux permease, MFS family n=1 Tax=Methanococcoides vulcani TaxID=1353158 RepID=A0A1I0BPH7_9EURY|nr:MFS transporter [Methanococcoides vulcani]SET08974.1 Predicted arabinose efflux permease, MFS family [Methanococcoides vulcani]
MDHERFLLYSSAFVIMGLSNAVIPILPELAATGQTTVVTSTSLLYSSFFLGALFTMLPFGILSDRFCSMKFVVLGLILSFTSGIAIAVTDDFMVLVLARFIEGASCGAFFPAAFSRLALFTKKMRYIGEFNFLINGGLAAGVAVTGYLADISIKYGIYLFVILTAFTLVFAFYHMTCPSGKQEKGNVPRTGSMSARSYLSFVTSKSSLSIWTISFLLAGTSGVLVSLYPEYSSDFLTKTELGIAISLLYLSTMISSITIARFNFSYDELIKKGIFITTLGILATIYFPMAGFTVIGLGSGIMLLGLPLAITTMKIDHGMAMGIYNTCIYAGLALMPLIAGVFTGGFDIETIFIATALLFGATVLLNGK